MRYANRVVYIIPGYREAARSKHYRYVADLFRRKNIRPISVSIHWKHRTMSDYINEFLSQVELNQSAEVYLFGFSYGALIASVAATVLKPKKLFLCSLSPYFKEDVQRILKKSELKSLGKKRLADFKTISFDRIARALHCKTYLVAGTLESPSIVKRIIEAGRKIKKASVHMVPNAAHFIGSAPYQTTLTKLIGSLAG